jgi:hypothetical protein
MVSGAPGRRTPIAIWQRLRRMVRQPSDVLLSLRLAYFIWQVPGRLAGASLESLLETLRVGRRPAAATPVASVERLRRLSRPWFRLPGLRQRNTCYVRSLLYYRYVDPGLLPLRIHFVVEPAASLGDRLKGHAWVTAGDQLLEPPDEDLPARTQSIYTYPPEGG